MRLPDVSQTLELQGHTFLPFPLNESSIVVDLGANTGEFSRNIVRRFHCRCIAVEPNPSFLDRIRVLPGVETIWTALSDCDGQIDLHLSDNPEASTALPGSLGANGRSIPVPARTLESLLKELSLTHVDLMKVDIEGSEVSMILSASDDVLRSVDQISIEFHDFCKLVTMQQISAVHRRLNGLNFDAIEFGSGNENSLFVRRDAAGIGRIRRGYVKYVLAIRALLHLMQRIAGRLRRTLEVSSRRSQE
jgi:FkbM family methyltransferase